MSLWWENRRFIARTQKHYFSSLQYDNLHFTVDELQNNKTKLSSYLLQFLIIFLSFPPAQQRANIRNTTFSVLSAISSKTYTTKFHMRNSKTNDKNSRTSAEASNSKKYTKTATEWRWGREKRIVSLEMFQLIIEMPAVLFEKTFLV